MRKDNQDRRDSRRRNTKHFTTGLLVVLLVMGTTSPVATADIPALQGMAEGEALTLAGTVYTDTFQVDGTLVASSDLTVVAEVIHIASTARVVGADGVAMRGDGNGVNIAFIATHALNVAGAVDAGDGADMPAAAESIGADGGSGGSLFFQAPSITVHGSARLTPGAGGAGSTVQVTGPAGPLVAGGNGGDAGTVILDGAVTIPDDSSVFGPADGGPGGEAHVEDAPGVLHVQGGDGGRGALMASTDTSLLSTGPTGYGAFPATIAASELAWLFENSAPKDSDGLREQAFAPGDNEFGRMLSKYFASCQKKDCIPSFGGGETDLPVCKDGCDPCQLTMIEYDCPGGGKPKNPCEDCVPPPPPPPPCGPLCDPTQYIPDDEPPSCDGQLLVDCILALVGLEDNETGCGNGADGADASDVGEKGGKGGDGANGNPGGFPFGSPGGNGGSGGVGGIGSATGGDGEDGRCWFSTGGDGGDGTATGGEGGNGGDGGDGGSSSGFGGPGGNGGSCGPGGAASGRGGQGGKGGTFGSPGAPGQGISTPGGPGVGGRGGVGGSGTLANGPQGAGGGCNLD